MLIDLSQLAPSRFAAETSLGGDCPDKLLKAALLTEAKFWSPVGDGRLNFVPARKLVRFGISRGILVVNTAGDYFSPLPTIWQTPTSMPRSAWSRRVFKIALRVHL